MTIFTCISLIFWIFLLKSATPEMVHDPEFDNYSNWLHNNRTLIMMKNLPKGANYTWKEYFKSWNMVYEEEMTMKELSSAAAKYIHNELPAYNWPRGYAIYLYIYIEMCSEEDVPKLELLETNADHSGKRKDIRNMSLIEWTTSYCASEHIREWCNMGDRLQIKMEANSTIQQTFIGANVTVICPFSLYHAIADAIRVKTKDSWKFTKLFYITIGVIASCFFIGIVVVIFVISEKHNRKLSRMAHVDHWVKFRFSEDYHSYDVPDTDDLEDDNQYEVELTENGAIYTPIRK